METRTESTRPALTLAEVRQIYPKSAGYTVYDGGNVANVYWCGIRVCGPRITEGVAMRSNAPDQRPGATTI